MPQGEQKLVLVVRRTRLAELIARYNTLEQARFYIEHLGADFDDYQREHETYMRMVHEAQTILGELGRLQMVDRDFLPNFLFGPDDVVLALGQDGLVANTVKYLNGQPLIGVNPDPARWDGVLLPYQVGDLWQIVPNVFAGRHKLRFVTMAQATLNNGQHLCAVNDLFIGVKSHTSARYTISLGELSEPHSSSGIIVSTGLGSTGWLKSVLAGSAAITAQRGGQPPSADQGFPCDSDYLCFTVREPFPSKASAANLVFGRVTPQQPLVLVSQMAENGVIFSDGIEKDFLEFNSGTQATIGLAEKKGHLVV